MKRTILLSIGVFVFMTGIISAELIRGIEIDFVTIGNPGNLPDSQVMETDGTSGYGAVDYSYKIGKYEITNSQWQTFISAAGKPTGSNVDGGVISPYDEDAIYTGDQQPANYISWFEAAQFCNYLTSGDKSQGVYLFSGNNTNPGDFLGIDRTAAILAYGTTYVLPTENEWYKAAYYKPDDSGYSLYANGLNTIPPANDGWNYSGGDNIPWDVGSGTMEQNGTYDMMGNIWEWNETFISSYKDMRGMRGGSFTDIFTGPLRSSYRDMQGPGSEWLGFGFRIASIPEPTTLLLLGIGGLALRFRRSRQFNKDDL